jgi:hypothetical protein
MKASFHKSISPPASERIYLIYKTRKSEHFHDEAALNAAIDKKYKTDMDAMRNLGNIANNILTKGAVLTIPANLTDMKSTYPFICG